MIRVALTAALVLALLHSVRAEDTGPRLNELVTINSDLVRIGDLVDNAGEAAGIAVYRAPDFGHTGSVAVGTVLETLARHNVTDVETDGLSEVIVTRMSRPITPADIEERIVRALAGQRGLGPVENLKVMLDRDLRTLHVEPHATTDLAITRLQVDPRSGRFMIAFELPGSTVARRMPLRFTGTVTEAFETTVLVRPVARGDVVRASDVALERRPREQMPAGAIELDQVVGMAARRAMRAGTVVRTADLVRPETVRRNETVTIVYEVPGIVLTVRGKANEGGSTGDHISVLNIQSNRTIQAQITGPGRVVVTSNRTRTLAAAAPNPNNPVSQ